MHIYTELQLYTRHMNQYIIAQSRHLLFANSFLSMTLSVMAVKLSLNTGRRTGCHKGVGGRQFIAPEKSAAQIPTKIGTMFFKHFW